MSQRQHSEKFQYNMRGAYKSQVKRGLNNNPSAALTVALSLALLLLLPPSANSANDTKRLPTDFPPTYAQLEFDEFASIKNLKDLLEERRFRVEMIVFTRSDQTRLGEEPLLFIEPRTLPKSIFALAPSLNATQGGVYAKTNRYCIGYPVIAIEPQLPEKLRALLNKENEPELAQWHKNSSLQKRLDAAPSQFNTQLDEDFLLPKNPRMGDPIDIDIPIDTKFSASELRHRGGAVTDELLTSADFEDSAKKPTTEPMIEMAIPRSAPQVSLSPYLNFINQLSLFDNNVKKDASGKIISLAKAQLEVDGEKIMCEGEGNGPVNALDNAIRQNVDRLNKYSKYLKDLKLVDYKVRILNTGTEAVTRVSIESTDSNGKNWFTIGVSTNIIDASFKALIDSLDYKLFKDNAPASL